MYKIIVTTLVNYIPSLLILVFSMVALHFSILLIDDYKRVTAVQSLYGQDSGFTLSVSEKEHVADKHSADVQRNLYWAVIAVGLAGFVLVLLNSHKLKQLKAGELEKKSNTALLKSRLAAMEATLDGIGVVDSDGNITYMNKALMNLHGISPEEKGLYIGKSWANLYTDKGREYIERELFPLLEKSGHWQGESEILRRDNQVIWAELSLTRLADGGMIGTARDVTEKREANKEREELQSQFFQAQKMEAIGRLAGGIAHDFNNILAAMNGYAEFLIDDLKAGSEQHRFAKNILQAGHQARGLVDQIMTFSRHKGSASEDMDLLVPVQESLSMLQASMPKTVELNADINLEAGPIEGNPTQISQVIMNLCVNAKDALEDNHGKITVALKKIDNSDYTDIYIKEQDVGGEEQAPLTRIEEKSPERTLLILGGLDPKKSYISLSVIDTGTGMSRVIMEHIFEPFFTTKPVDKGTGLGLSTVHGVVISHAGAMVVDSTLNKGTSFELFFPVRQSADLEVEVASVNPVSDIVGRILLVEDQENVSEMMMNMLRRMGHEIHLCVNGMEALDFIRENPGRIDLVITDQNMPKMMGLELIVQAHADFPDLPFILLSGYNQKEMKALMQDHPAIKFMLKKPASREALSQKINAVLTKKKSRRKRSMDAA